MPPSGSTFGGASPPPRFPLYMLQTHARAAALIVALVALCAATASPAAAQTGPASPPTAPAASPEDGTATAGPRRRPTPRAARRSLDYRPAQRAARRDSLIRRVSSPDREITIEELAADVAARTASRRESRVVSRAAAVEQTLRTDGPNWIGIPYRWGGTTRRGIDCSAFVQQYVRQNLGIELPRTTAGQRYEGVSIDKSELMPGDLVFFRRRGIRHVGVYLSDGEFIHASSSRGVTISRLDSRYWSRHYWMSRRILEDTSDRWPTPRAEARRVRG